MNNTILLNKLNNIFNESNDGKKQILLGSLISDIKAEIMLSDATCSKKRNNFILSYHKKLVKQHKKLVLAFSSDDAIENKQVFTDSYFLVALNEQDKTVIPDYKNAGIYNKDIKLNKDGFNFDGMHYPNIKPIINGFSKDIKITLDTQFILKTIKAYESILITGINFDTMYSDIELLGYNEIIERVLLTKNENIYCKSLYKKSFEKAMNYLVKKIENIEACYE